MGSDPDEAIRWLHAIGCRENDVGTCSVCGNEYDRSFDVMMQGDRYTFDSFECAIQKLAPLCAHCQCRVIGHGVEVGRTIYCCAHCAKQMGQWTVRDHA